MKSITTKWEEIKSTALKMDFIGPQFTLENNDASRFQSWQGLIWSIIAVATCATIGFMFGQEIYQRNNPMVSISQEFISYSDVWVKEFPLMFSFISTNGTSLNEDNLDNYFDTMIYMASMDNEGRFKDYEEVYKFEKCDSSKYTKYRKDVEEMINNKPKVNFLCMKHDEKSYFSNSYFAVNSTNLNYIVKACSKFSNSNKKKKCAEREDLVNTVENMLITITYVTSFVDFYNFTDPVRTYMDEMTTQASLYLTRRSYVRFVYNAFQSDDGILLEKKYRKDFIYMDSVVPDDLNVANSGPNKDVLFWLACESPKLRNLIARNYMKAQDLLAKVGGLVNAIIIITRIITYHYLRYLYLFHLKECAINAIFQNDLEQTVLKTAFGNNKIRASNIQFQDNLDEVEYFKGSISCRNSIKKSSNVGFPFKKISENRTNGQNNINYHPGNSINTVEISNRNNLNKSKKDSIEEVDSKRNFNDSSRPLREEKTKEKVKDRSKTTKKKDLIDGPRKSPNYIDVNIRNNSNNKIKINQKTESPKYSHIVINNFNKNNKDSNINDNSEVSSNGSSHNQLKHNSLYQTVISNFNNQYNNNLKYFNNNNSKNQDKNNKNVINKNQINNKNLNKKDLIIDDCAKIVNVYKKKKVQSQIKSHIKNIYQDSSYSIKDMLSISAKSSYIHRRSSYSYRKRSSEEKSEQDINEQYRRPEEPEVIPVKRAETLFDINKRRSFFTPNVINKILHDDDKGYSYPQYLKSLLCCIHDLHNKYHLKMKAVKKVLSIHTYCKLVVSQYNSLDSLLCEDVKVHA